MRAQAYSYRGGELDLFSQAKNWKAYFARCLRPYIGGDVAEIGAGIGSTTLALLNPDVASWLCIEPDPGLAKIIERKLTQEKLSAHCRVMSGFLDGLSPSESFDTILYVDVLEHIQADRDEVQRAYARLRPGGRLIVLAPAFGMLFSAFDRAVGHFRRYTVDQLRSLTPSNATVIRVGYLDSAGFLLSLGNRLLVRASMPKPAQIKLWDTVIVPISRTIDPVVARYFGRSAVIVWRRPLG